MNHIKKDYKNNDQIKIVEVSVNGVIASW